MTRDYVEVPGLQEAYATLQRAERAERQRLCADQGHGDTIDVTRLSDPGMRLICTKCGREWMDTRS